MRGTVETALLNPRAFVYVGRSECWCTKSVHFRNEILTEVLTDGRYEEP
jgi:hypothetical protein